MSASKVTVVMPTYGHAAYIRQALDSVMAQSLAPDDVIVINDGSDDDTDAQVQPYLHGVRYIKRPHRGIADTLNEANRLVHTDYILYLASDDWLTPDAIETLQLVLEKHPGVGVVHANRLKVDDNLRALPDGKIPHDGPYLDMELMLTWYTTYSPAILCRRDAVLSAGPIPDYPYCQDWWLWISIALQGWSFFGVNSVLGYYRRHKANTSSLAHQEFVNRDEIRMLEEFIRSGRLPQSLRDTARRAVWHRRRVLGWLYVSRGDRERARREFAALIKTGQDSVNTVMGLVAASVPYILYQIIRNGQIPEPPKPATARKEW